MGRLSKTIGGATTGFVYDGANTIQELSGASPTANLLTGGIDQNLIRTDAAGPSTFLADGLSSTLALLDAAGTTVSQYTYQPFGGTTVSGAAGNAFQFTSRENDGTGLYYYRARYYHPTLQGFISEDPIGFKGGDVNLFAYVSNSPNDNVDPEGTTIFWPYYLFRCLYLSGRVLELREQCKKEYDKGCKDNGWEKTYIDFIQKYSGPGFDDAMRGCIESKEPGILRKWLTYCAKAGMGLPTGRVPFPSPPR